MADRTLAQAVADLRLSDTRLRQDLQAARALLLSAAEQLERQLRITIPVELDRTGLDTQFEAIVDNLRDEARIDLEVGVDGTALIASIDAIEENTAFEGVTVPVDADTSAAQAQIAGLQDVVDPIGVPAVLPQSSIDEIDSTVQNQVVPAFGAAGEQAGGLFGDRLTRSLQNVLAAGSLTLGAFVATSLFRGFQRLTTIEDATASLTVALQSATAAADTLDDVLDVVRGTPFNLDEFATAASNLVAFGIEAEKVPGYLTAIGEAAASKGGRASEFAQRLAFSFGQIAVQGRITNEEILSLQLAGVDALKILGNQAGVTSFEMRKLISEGIIPADEALDGLTDGIVNGTTGINGATVAFAGTMENLRKTLTGAIGGFRAASARFGVSLIEPFQDTLTVGFNAASDSLDAFGASVEKNLGDLVNSPGLQRFTEWLEELPDLTRDLIDNLGDFQPVLAPLLAVFAGLGSSALGNALGPLGNLLPGISGPVGAITVGLTALIATVPELREQALPILQEIGQAGLEVTAILGPALADAVDASIPVLQSLLEIVGEMAPIATNLAVAGAALLEGFVPALEIIGQVLGAIPAPILAGLTGLFVASRGIPQITAPFQGLRDQLLALEQTQALIKRGGIAAATAQGQLGQLEQQSTRTALAFNRIGISAQQVAQFVNTAAVSVGGFVSGIGLASDDATGKVLGLGGAVTSIAAGFATGGPLGAGLAAAATGLGAITGGFINANREAEAFRRQVRESADDIIEDFGRIGGSIDEVEISLRNLFGEELDPTTFQIRFSAEATANFIKDLDEDLKLAFASLSNVGVDIDLGDIISIEAGNLDATLDALNEYSVVADGLSFVRRQLEQQFDDFDLNRLINDSPFAPEITDAQRRQVERLQELIPLVDESTEKLANLGLDVRGLEGEEAITTVKKGLQERIRFERVLQGELVKAIDLQEQNRAAFEATQRVALESYGIAAGLIDDYIQEARALEIDPIDLVKQTIAEGQGSDVLGLDGVVRDIEDIDAAAQDAGEALKAWEATIDQIDAAFSRVSEEVASILSRQDAVAAIQNLEGLGDALNEIINERELQAAERLADQIDSQYDRVKDAQERLRDAARDFQFDEQIALERIAELEGLGATRGAAGVRRDLERDRQQVEDLRADLAEEEQKLVELQAEQQQLSAIPITLGQVLAEQAAERGLTLSELLVSGETEESRDTFRKFLAPALSQVVDDINSVLAGPGGTEAAAAVAEEYQTLLAAAFETGLPEGADLGPFTDLVSSLDDGILQANAVAFALEFVEAAQGGLDAGEQLELRTSLSDQEFTAAELEQFSAFIEALDPSILVNVTFEGDIGPLIEDVQSQLVEINEIAPNLFFAIDGAGNTVRLNLGPGQTQILREGGILHEDHSARIHRQLRIFAEPETGGEAYIPLTSRGDQRQRSQRILRDVANLFRYDLVPHDITPPDVPVSEPAIVMAAPSVAVDNRGIASAVAAGVERAMEKQRRYTIGESYDRAVHVDTIQIGDPSDRKAVRHVVRELSQLALRRR